MALTMSALLAASCGGSDEATDSTTSLPPATTAVDATTTSAAESTTTTETAPTTLAPTTEASSDETAAPIAVDPSWPRYEDAFFVWGVDADDVLHVRSGPGVSNPVVADLAPDERGVVRFDESTRVGSSLWTVVEVPGGAGWVNATYLRPVGTRPPVIEGTLDPRVETAADDVQAALGAGDYEALAGFVDPDRGLVISIHASITDESPVLTPSEVAGAATDRAERLWGHTDGEGAPVRSTVGERFASIAGNTGLTSTDAIGFDVRLGVGNSIDTIAEVFPGSAVVEYHFEGTSVYGDFDWSSVRFVFDTTKTAPTGRPALLAIVEDTWTI